jgi:hypothetical protein
MFPAKAQRAIAIDLKISSGASFVLGIGQRKCDSTAGSFGFDFAEVGNSTYSSLLRQEIIYMNKVREAVALFCLLASSCIPLRRNLVMTIPDAPTKPVQLSGIEESLNTAAISKLLIIHGMGDHDFTYADPLTKGLSAQLKLTPFSCYANRIPIKDDAGAPPYAEMTVCDYRRADLKVLRVYTLVWSPLTTHLKLRNLEYDWKQYGNGRCWANRAIKDAIIDHALSDAVLYAGQFAPRMRYAVAQAICVTIKDQYELSAPCRLHENSPSVDTERSDIFIVTHSLGSMMLFESLAELGRESPKSIAELGRHVKLIAMFANQLPLLQLARYRVAQSTVTLPADEPEVTLDLKFDSLFMFRPPQKPLTVVAFNDRNDLLSYPMPDNWPQLFPNFAGRVKFVNAFNTNALYAIAGIFANPASAHGGYWDNRKIMRVLAKGYP